MNREFPRWYAVCCKPRQEMVAEENLRRQDYHVYLPRMRIRQSRRGQMRDSVAVLFPRYIFIRLDPQRRSMTAVRSTRGVVGMVRFGAEPAVVPDAVMDVLLQSKDAASGLHPNIQAKFNVGDPVKLVRGPLLGMEALFQELDGDKRVVVLLEMLGKANKIRISREWIARAA